MCAHPTRRPPAAYGTDASRTRHGPPTTRPGEPWRCLVVFCAVLPGEAWVAPVGAGRRRCWRRRDVLCRRAVPARSRGLVDGRRAARRDRTVDGPALARDDRAVL